MSEEKRRIPCPGCGNVMVTATRYRAENHEWTDVDLQYVHYACRYVSDDGRSFCGFRGTAGWW